MNCPRCGSEIRPGQKFCAECGLALSTACPNCGTPYEGNPRFCAECGFVLRQPTAGQPATATPAVVAERRFVTILFADLVGFTTLSEHEDPEQVRELLTRYFDLARSVIDGYGGTVEKFIGDAVMAVWGAPVAREDDPERAVRAGLELVERVRDLSIGGQSLSLRAGVLSGEAAVTLGAPAQGMVAGDLVNTASRLQSVARPGVVLVGESTYQATNAAIAYEAAGEQLLKGKQAPVAAWRALRVVARIGGEGRDEGLEPPFVGRDEELRLLKEQIHAAERENKLRMVAISGQAGIGKSRLLWELEKYLDGLAGPQLYYWHQGRSPSYGEGIAFWALGEMVRRRARIVEGDDEPTTRLKLDEALDDIVPDPAERRWLGPALGALLGIDEADWAAREQLFSAWRVFFERVADKGPTVMAFEDLQWADDGLLDFIEHLLEWARDKPILVVTLARPELLERRPNFGFGHRALVALHLEPLSAEAMADLLRGLVPALAEHDLERIVERAEGVPLYAVETIRALADGGHLARRGDVYELVGELPELAVPPTLRALISSRLDALATEDRALLQDASVLGCVFAVPALSALTDRPADELEGTLRALAAKELVSLENDPRSPERGRYRFRQSMICEISYATLAKRERRARHLAVAHYFDTIDDDELAGVKATHYLQAFRAAPEGEEGATVAAQARVALRAAADRAARLHSNAQALEYYEQAMAVTFEEADLDDLRQRAARAAWLSANPPKAELYARTAIDSFWRRGDTEQAARMTAHFGGWLLESSRVDEGMALIRSALDRLPADAERATIDLNGSLARGYLFRGEGEPALAAISNALETAERLRVRGPTLQLVITKSWALTTVGRYREGLALLTGAMHIADAEDDMLSRVRTRFNMSSYVVQDDPRRALSIANEGVAISEQYGVALSVQFTKGNAAHAALMIGDLDEVLRLAEGVTQATTSMGSFVHGYAAVAHSLRGELETARELMEEVDRMVAESTSVQDVTTQQLISAMVAFGAGELADARRLATASRDGFPGGEAPLAAVIAGHTSVLLADADALRSDLEWFDQNTMIGAWVDRLELALRAALLALDGSAGEATTAYRRAVADLRSADLPFDLAIVLLERARLLGAVDADATAGRDEAEQIFGAMGARDLSDRLEAGAPAPATLMRPPAPRTEGAAVGARNQRRP